jgi:hypothetical protein
MTTGQDTNQIPTPEQRIKQQVPCRSIRREEECDLDDEIRIVSPQIAIPLTFERLRTASKIRLVGWRSSLRAVARPFGDITNRERWADIACRYVASERNIGDCAAELVHQ